MTEPFVADDHGSRGIARASALFASGTIVSRVLGFISAVVLANAIGIVGAGADAFTLANQLPNNIYALVAGGLLSAVIVPQIVRAGLHHDGGATFINRLVTLSLVVFVVLTVVATACAPLLVRLYAQSGPNGGFSEEDFTLATAFAYWCLPQIFFYALYSLLGEVLNARGIFGPFTWTPVLNNLVVISGLIVFIAAYGPDPQHRLAQTWTSAEIALLAGTATLGIAVQAFGLLLFWRRTGIRYRPDFRWRRAGLGRTGQAAAWVFGIFLVTQVSAVFESRVASIASGEASLAVLKYGWLIFILPHSVVTVSVTMAYFTRMSEHVRDGRIGELRNDIGSALRTILLIMVFSAIGLMVLAYPFSAIFASDYKGVQGLGNVVVAYLVGLVPFTVFFVLLRVYYAMDLTRAAFVIQVAQAVLYVSGALAIQAFVPVEWIAFALALLLSIATTFQSAMSALYLRPRTGGLQSRSVAVSSLWYFSAMVPSAGAGIACLALLGGVGAGAFAVSSVAGSVTSMAVTGTVMACVYCAVLWITRNPEFRSIAQPILRRMGGIARA
ncbi:MAG: murein biosynthesis integral membrane protein MurJ [Salinibacterium sp.]|nr:murein biosynthesis integral membrane protein MurJ [Salinibacterium sp.]